MLHLHDILKWGGVSTEPDTAKVHSVISHALLLAHSFDTPEAAADALLKRLDLEGYRIVPKEVP